MAVLTNRMQCLGRLKASQLHQLAVALGCACSGSKEVVAYSICQSLASEPLDKPETFNSLAPTSTDRGSQLSIVSIDVGIRNLAYAHLICPRPHDIGPANGPGLGTTTKPPPMLSAWERHAAFPSENQDDWTEKPAEPDKYVPSSYASAAYHFITDIFTKFDPTHILIEQQRFRSGGSSAVTEWTIRVGLFEGMLHAVLQTLREERKDRIRLQAVSAISPARTARFWLGASGGMSGALGKGKIAGREGKQAKVDIVGKSFLSSADQLVETGAGQARAMEAAFLEKWYATSKTARALKGHKQMAPSKSGGGVREPKQAKLDDLADCLLQAIAWLRWQRMRELLAQDLGAADPIVAIQLRLKALSAL